MFPTVELHPQGHQHPCDIAAAEHDVAARQRHQYVEGCAGALCGLPHLPFPGVGDPVGRDLLEHQVAVAIPRKAPRARFEQGGSGAPNGVLGRAYMAAVTPFRYLIVYPRMLKQIGWKWLSYTGAKS